MTLAECLLAVVILSVAILGITFATTAGHQHMSYSDTVLRAVRIAEHLMEEIVTRDYEGTGSPRPAFHLDDFDGFHEEIGTLTDFAGLTYGDLDQRFGRSVSVIETDLPVSDLDDIVISGKTVVITMRNAKGDEWLLSRFLPEPNLP